MGDAVRVGLYGVLPSLAASLFLVSRFGPRWLGLAAGLGLLTALALLLRMPAWPHVLLAGNNDGTEWLCWCVLAAGVCGVGTGGRKLTPWVGLPLGAAALGAQVWLMLTNPRRQWEPREAWLQQGAAAATFVAVWLLVRRALADRGSAALAAMLAVCLAVDAALLAHTGSAVLGCLAGAVAAAWGAAAVTALWRTSLRLEPPLALAFTAAHCGLLLAGVQLSSLGPPPALLAALAPAALAMVGPRPQGDGAGNGAGDGASDHDGAVAGWRLLCGGLAAAGLLAVAVALAFGGGA